MPRNSDAGPNEWVDKDEAPELTDAFFDQADVHDAGKLVRRGRPRADYPKVLVSLRLDQDVLARLRADGPGWQTRVNEMLRKAVGDGKT